MALDAHVTNILLQMDALVSHACSNINIACQPYEAESKRIPLSTVLQPWTCHLLLLRGTFMVVSPSFSRNPFLQYLAFRVFSCNTVTS